MKKGQIWISAVLYILIAAVAMVLILQVGIPLLNQMRDRSSYTRAKDTMIGIDKHITDIASEGQGSQRVIPIEVQQGQLFIGDNIRWQLETSSRVIEPRTKVEFGNVNVYTSIDVSATDAVTCSYISGECYVLENSKIIVLIAKSPLLSPFDTNDLIQSIQFKETGDIIPGGFTFSIDGQGVNGTGFTELVPEGNNTELDRASVLLHMSNTGIQNYDLKLTLESETDFIKAELSVVE